MRQAAGEHFQSGRRPPRCHAQLVDVFRILLRLSRTCPGCRARLPNERSPRARGIGQPEFRPIKSLIHLPCMGCIRSLFMPPDAGGPRRRRFCAIDCLRSDRQLLPVEATVAGGDSFRPVAFDLGDLHPEYHHLVDASQFFEAIFAHRCISQGSHQAGFLPGFLEGRLLKLVALLQVSFGQQPVFAAAGGNQAESSLMHRNDRRLADRFLPLAMTLRRRSTIVFIRRMLVSTGRHRN